jgi:imidazole glycerol-phosphate synthase subunit HisH
MKIAIIDYQLSNLFSVKNACDFAGLDSVITSDIDEILKSDAAILPGVGAFNDAMLNIERLNLVAPIKSFIDSGKPFLGVCLGLQLLFTDSVEFGDGKGLNVIEGSVKRLPGGQYEDRRIKIPHMGWNRIRPNVKNGWNNTLLNNIEIGQHMYFIHSFYVVPENKNEILTTTNYAGLEFCSGIKKDNVVAFQFHPEKSATDGIKIYSNWLNSI